MALFQKLFSSKATHNKNEENVSEKPFAFKKDQVRIMLFRECDFRGRKLLFDSKAVNKVPLDSNSSAEYKDTKESPNNYAEVSSGYGYRFTKPHPEFTHIAEMVFGSVALSFRGTYFKIHSLSSPNRMIFSQIFPSPHKSGRRKVFSSRSCPSTANQSFQHSTAKLDDSGASSNTSTSERLSDRSTASDTILVCRRHRSSPVEVTKSNGHSLSNSSIVNDSGCGDPSYASFNSFSPSLTTLDCNSFNYGVFSSGNLYKRWLRSRSTSLDNSGTSLATSTEEFSTKTYYHNSKLAFSLIVELTPGQEENLIQFFMEHVSLLESVLWRSRHTVDLAYCHPKVFISSMLDITNLFEQWLVNLLSGPYLHTNLWLLLSSTCDINNSITAFTANNGLALNKSQTALEAITNNNSSRINFNLSFMSSSNYTDKSSLFNFSSLFRSEPMKSSFDENRNSAAEKFLKNFCELINTIDVKGTNFFMSTLLTAVLTHHLGWVSTCAPTEGKNNAHVKEPFNLLWGQLSDLFGAVGYPTKMAQTVITGTNKKETISKILNSLTYFIRCCDFERNFFTRVDVDEENKTVEGICLDNSFIPKENYKKYEDHLREMMEPSHFLRKNTPVNLENENIEMTTFSNSVDEYCKDQTSKFNEPLKKVAPSKFNLNRNKSCLGNLSQLKDEDVGTNKSDEHCCDEDNIEILKKMNLYRKPSCSNFKEPVKTDSELCKDGNKLTKDCDSNNVIFLLGDNEELVNIKKETTGNNSNKKHQEEKRIPHKSLGVKNSGMKKVKSSKNLKNLQELLMESTESIDSSHSNRTNINRPTFLNLSQNKNRSLSHDYTGIFKDEDFAEYKDSTNIKPSTSWTALNSLDTESSILCDKKIDLEESAINLSRAQSEPPEVKEKEEKTDVIKSKYRYSGYKFTLQQYPQILENYLKSKNLEIASFQFGDKTGFKQFYLAENDVNTIHEDLSSDDEEIETLQTPSNASEMEFATDLMIEKPRVLHARESSTEPVPQYTFIRTSVPNTIVKGNVNRKVSICDGNFKTERKIDEGINCKMRTLELPMPKSTLDVESVKTIPYTKSLMRDIGDFYMPDVVLQGITVPKTEWESKLKSDLALGSQHSLLDQPIEEAVAIVANLDTWEVQLMSSHTYVIDKGTTGIRVGMSQLVANMLESLLHMWKLNASPYYCLMYIEQRLQELCIRSKALAQLLLATEFCSMEHLTSTLQLEVNDIPLLMAVASANSPQVTQKYGLSFQ